MGKELPRTIACEWVTADSVEGLKCKANTAEELLDMDVLQKAFEYRNNLLL
jgi:hypothetical protein